MSASGHMSASATGGSGVLLPVARAMMSSFEEADDFWPEQEDDSFDDPGLAAFGCPEPWQDEPPPPSAAELEGSRQADAGELSKLLGKVSDPEPPAGSESSNPPPLESPPLQTNHTVTNEQKNLLEPAPSEMRSQKQDRNLAPKPGDAGARRDRLSLLGVARFRGQIPDLSSRPYLGSKCDLAAKQSSVKASPCMFGMTDQKGAHTGLSLSPS